MLPMCLDSFVTYVSGLYPTAPPNERLNPSSELAG